MVFVPEDILVDEDVFLGGGDPDPVETIFFGAGAASSCSSTFGGLVVSTASGSGEELFVGVVVALK